VASASLAASGWSWPPADGLACTTGLTRSGPSRRSAEGKAKRFAKPNDGAMLATARDQSGLCQCARVPWQQQHEDGRYEKGGPSNGQACVEISRSRSDRPDHVRPGKPTEVSDGIY